MVKEDKSGDRALELFLGIGLDERTAKNTIANNKVRSNLTAVIREADVLDGCDRTVGNLLYTVATKFPANALVHRPSLLKYIISSKVRTPAQLHLHFSLRLARITLNWSNLKKLVVLLAGHFMDDKDSTEVKLVFNRTVTLRDSYGKAGK